MNAPKRAARGTDAAKTAANALPEPLKQKVINTGSGKATMDQFGEPIGKTKWMGNPSPKKKWG